MCGAVDVMSLEGRAFLEEVLRYRSAGALGASVIERLVVASGGILRDLLLMARLAVEEAYVGGGDVVTESHVSDATHRMGCRSSARSTASCGPTSSSSSRPPTKCVDPSSSWPRA